MERRTIGIALVSLTVLALCASFSASAGAVVWKALGSGVEWSGVFAMAALGSNKGASISLD